jgi:hypothetical protein
MAGWHIEIGPDSAENPPTIHPRFIGCNHTDGSYVDTGEFGESLTLGRNPAHNEALSRRVEAAGEMKATTMARSVCARG